MQKLQCDITDEESVWKGSRCFHVLCVKNVVRSFLASEDGGRVVGV